MNRREVLQAAAGIAIVGALPEPVQAPTRGDEPHLIVESTVHDGPFNMEFGYESSYEFGGTLEQRFKAAIEWFKRKRDIAPDLGAPIVIGFYKGEGVTWPLPGLRGLPTRHEGYEVVIGPYLLDGISTEAVWMQGRYDFLDVKRVRKMNARSATWNDLATVHVELPMRYSGGRPDLRPA